MSRSKLRSEARGENGQKNRHSSVFSRTLSSSIFCRGNSIGAQIDPKALVKSNVKKPLKEADSNSNSNSNSSENQIGIVAMEDELRRTKEKLHACELEKQRIAEELREAKASGKVEDLRHEIERLEKMLSEKGKRIASLEKENGRSKQLESILAEKDEFINRLNVELREVRERDKGSMVLVSENRRRIKQLECEIERRKESESRVSQTLAARSREFNVVEFELQKAKDKMAIMYEQIESSETFGKHDDDSGRGAWDLKVELKLARETEKKALSQLETMRDEMDILRREWKEAIEAEQNSAKAMDDLALALAELAAESKEAKEKLATVEAELEHTRERVELLKGRLEEARQEAEVQRNTAERLRVESEETLLAVNAKEMGFVSCIKRAEEEKAAAMQESARAAESLEAAENMTRAAREEANKSRDLLKQSISEANAATAAARLAQDENSQLKDSLAKKEETMYVLTQENERLRNSVKHLKGMLSSSDASSSSDDDSDHTDKHKKKKKDKDKDSREDFTLNLDELKLLNEPDNFKLKIQDEDPEKVEALKGSIFDTNAETPKSEPHTPKLEGKHRHRRYSFSYMSTSEVEDRQNSEEDNKHPQHKGVLTMFRKVGDLLAIKKGLPHPHHTHQPNRKESPSQSPSRSHSSIE